MVTEEEGNALLDVVQPVLDVAQPVMDLGQLPRMPGQRGLDVGQILTRSIRETTPDSALDLRWSWCPLMISLTVEVRDLAAKPSRVPLVLEIS
ncbi:hypothetical protein ACIBQX_42540 [Nonomuraea sp. NPDC049714]|uniref:hypothetical protein n=1 Tax=Nonomuraea sp. NPDC049714 TaxID=3364357 RepID=UPI0037A00EFB